MKLEFISFGAKIEDFFRAHEDDAGIDVRAIRDMTIKAHSIGSDGLGFGLELPAGFMGLLTPRSSLVGAGLISQIAPIDPYYTGEWHYGLLNTTSEDITIKKGDRIAQIVIQPITYVDIVEHKGKTRGKNGLGSTGRN